MSGFLLRVPEDMLVIARQIAETSQQPVEEVLLNRLQNALPLPTLPPDEEAELEALSHLSDDALWTIAREQMAPHLQQRMQVLMDKNSLGTITSDEHMELGDLVERGQRLTLRKSEAAALLTRRGYKLKPQDMVASE